MISVQDRHNIDILMNQMVSSNLPPFLDEYFKKPDRLFEKVKLDKIPVYQTIGKSDYVELNIKKISRTESVLRNGSEAIKYFAFKNNGSKRMMGIVNPIYFFSFVYNAVSAHNDWIMQLYNSEEIEDIIQKSNSPILGLGQFFIIDYENQDIQIFEKYKNYTNELDRKLNKSFEKNEEKSFLVEGSAPYYLSVDLENYYSSIDTNLLFTLSSYEPFNGFDDSIDVFFKFLGGYNRSVNENQTNGIITGPISSFITAEFLSLALDAKFKNKDITTYYRYVDDYSFYSYSQSELEKNIEIFDRTIRPFSLTRKFEKTETGRGFSKNNKANIDEVHSLFPYLNIDFRGEILTLDKVNYKQLRKYIESLVSQNYLSQIKTVLTKLKNTIKDDRVRIDEQIVSYFIPFILKVSYIHPRLVSHVYKLVDQICSKLAKNAVPKLIKQLLVDRDYILDYYSESEFEIWFYYIITKYSDSEIRKQELDYYLSQAEKESFSTEPIILSFFVKNDFSNNKKIFNRLKDKYCLNFDSLKINSYDESLPLQGIAMSRWWIVLLELFIYIRRTEKKSGRKPKGFVSLQREIVPYFYKNKDKEINYSEMGIFCELL
uniref:hypothetical protein n=1 Tax=uncultured Streptococcus sp. TaxID=83427 RepID=UPI0025F4F5B3|nr:hypothetical protein [uncultured Streptococcus sp.]